MATLIAVFKPDGKLLGRCDARCYDGSGDRCRCICGGKNHRAGLQTAARQTLAMTTIDPDGLYEHYPIDRLTIEKSKHLSYWAHPTLFTLEG